MFKFLKKLIKWTIIITVLGFVSLVSIGIYIEKNMTPEERAAAQQLRDERAAERAVRDQQREAERIAAQQLRDQRAKEAEAERAVRDQQREAERIAAQQAASAAEDQRLRDLAAENARNAAAQQRSRIESQLTTYCMDQIKNNALYPTKVDFHVFKTERRVFDNFSNSDKPNRFMFNTGGEMMNGFGNMVPFTAVCKVDFNNTEFSLVEVLIQ